MSPLTHSMRKFSLLVRESRRNYDWQIMHDSPTVIDPWSKKGRKCVYEMN